MAGIDVSGSGTFKIAGDIPVHRLGFGAMRLTGQGIWGEPADVDEAKRVLRRLPDLAINFVDTADSYGPEVSERLIGEVLGGNRQITIATKSGLARPGPERWIPLARPEYLRQQVHLSLRRLKRERIDLWQLHRIDPKVPRDEQFGVVADMQREGLIRHVGLSNVTVEEIEAAERFVRVATVQNRYNLVDRKFEPVVELCTQRGIGFIPWYPLAAGELARPGGVLDAIAQRVKATPSQVALAWVLRRSPVMLPIPGTARVKHLEENAAAAAVRLTDQDFAALDAAGRQEAEQAEGAAAVT